MSEAQREAVVRLKRAPQPYNLFNWRVRSALMHAGLAEIFVEWGSPRLMLRLTPKGRAWQ